MKGTRAFVMLALALVAGLAATVLAARWLAQQGAGDSVKVVVAAQDMNLGQALNPAMLEEVSWPRGSVPKGSFDKVAALDGRVLKTTVQRGEPVLDGKLAPLGTKGGLSAVIGDGKRAISVKVNEVVGVAGFALPGNYVDVLVNAQDDKERQVSKIVLERILVLAVAQEASRDETKPKVVSAVTLEVTPEQAEKLDLARSIGSLSLVLRNQIDQDPTESAGVRKEDLLGKAQPAPAPAPVAKAAPAPVKRAPAPAARPAPVAAPPAAQDRDRVEVIRGVQRSTAEL
jgi:pilus assembly protein CpaB